MLRTLSRTVFWTLMLIGSLRRLTLRRCRTWCLMTWFGSRLIRCTIIVLCRSICRATRLKVYIPLVVLVGIVSFLLLIGILLVSVLLLILMVRIRMLLLGLMVLSLVFTCMVICCLFLIRLVMLSLAGRILLLLRLRIGRCLVVGILVLVLIVMLFLLLLMVRMLVTMVRLLRF